MDFIELIDLAAERLGGAALAANDEFFAGKENLLKAGKAVFDPHAYTDRGKLMDGWETRRRRDAERTDSAPKTDAHDWCLIRLGIPGIVHGVIVDTAFFRGNYPEFCSIEGCAVDGHPTPEAILGPSTEWIELLPHSSLEGDSPNAFHIENPHRFTHLRLNIFPDGGVARLRVHGEPLPPSWRLRSEADLAAIENGAQALRCSDMFFGNRHNLLMPGRSTNMSDGWETRRRRREGHEWMTIQLAAPGDLHQVEVDTSYFKGNAPGACSLEISDDATTWRELLGKSPLQPHTRHHFEVAGSGAYVRFNIFPDGGVSRLHIYGNVTAAGRDAVALQHLNTLLPSAARARFLACCGSAAWAAAMAQRRPFPGVEELHTDATHQFAELTSEDWRDAFSRHPRIGESAGGSKWSSEEQAAARGAEADTMEELANWNQMYFKKFGYIYIVCATGKAADEMLESLKERLTNSPAVELRIAAAEQAKITHLRLDKLIASI